MIVDVNLHTLPPHKVTERPYTVDPPGIHQNELAHLGKLYLLGWDMGHDISVDGHKLSDLARNGAGKAYSGPRIQPLGRHQRAQSIKIHARMGGNDLQKLRAPSPDSGPRMIFFINPFQTLPRYKGIDLGAGNITVAQHLLNKAKVSVSRQKMGGEGMP